MHITTKKYILYIGICLINYTFGKAQSFLPFSIWNHAGINSVYIQPASIADTRLKFDMMVLGIDINVGNNLYGMKRGFLFDKGLGDNFDKYKYTFPKRPNHRLMTDIDMQLFGFMVPLSKKSSLGVSTRLRHMINIDGVTPDMMDLFDNEISQFIGNKYNLKDLSFRTNAWTEFGVTYAREILDRDAHYFKGGVTLKLLQPLTSAFLYIKEAGYEIIQEISSGSDNPDDYIKIKATGELAFPKGFDSFEDFENFDNYLDDIRFFENMGVGFDLGFVYEYRPDYLNYKEEKNGQSVWKRYEPSKYLFRIGFSLIDIGSMRYNTDWTQSFSMKSASSILESDITDLNELKVLFDLKKSDTYYRVALPTAISIQTDWRINQLFYLGIHPYFALRKKMANKIATHYMSSINVTPRIEMAGFGLSLPVAYDQFKAFNVGLGLRLGPLWIGSGNVFNVLLSNKLREFNFCMGMKITIHHKKPGNRSDITIETI